MLQKLINKIEQINQERIYKKALPTNYISEDIFLVSFPKSGNTWLRFLIANAIKVHYEIDKDVNFFSILEIIPEVLHQNTSNINAKTIRREGMFGRSDLPRIIKSHSSYNPYFNRVILLVRDPRDVILSWFRYLKNYQKIPQDTKLSEFLQHPNYGIKSWVEHTESWYCNQRIGQIVKIFKYEDIIEETDVQIAMILELLGICTTPEKINLAIELSSREKMKKSEDAHMSNSYLESRQIPFVSKGRVKGSKNLSQSDKIIIEQETKEIAEKLGYKYQ